MSLLLSACAWVRIWPPAALAQCCGLVRSMAEAHWSSAPSRACGTCCSSLQARPGPPLGCTVQARCSAALQHLVAAVSVRSSLPACHIACNVRRPRKQQAFSAQWKGTGALVAMQLTHEVQALHRGPAFVRAASPGPRAGVGLLDSLCDRPRAAWLQAGLASGDALPQSSGRLQAARVHAGLAFMWVGGEHWATRFARLHPELAGKLRQRFHRLRMGGSDKNFSVLRRFNSVRPADVWGKGRETYAVKHVCFLPAQAGRL